jgi:hypothetical protein
MREIRMSGSMRGGRKRAFARRACLLLYKAPAGCGAEARAANATGIMTGQLRLWRWPPWCASFGGRT